MGFRAHICADPHITFSAYGKVGRDGVNFRTEDFMAAFAFAVDKAVEDKPNFFFVLGDLFDSPYPASNIRRFFNRQLTKLLSAGIQVRLLSGNHDFCKQHHALEALMDLNIENMKVIDEASIEEIKIGDDPPVLVMYFPHHFQIERNEKPLRDAFSEFCNNNRRKIKNVHLQNGSVLLMGHFGVYGAKQNDAHSNDDLRAVTMEELDQSGADHVFLGDYHIHQVFPTKKTVSMFSGSLERTNSKDIESPKGFVVFDTNCPSIEKYGKARFVEYPNARPFVEISGTPTEVMQKLESIKSDGAILKVTCVGKEDEIRAFRAKDKKALTDRAAELGCKYVDVDEVVIADPAKQIQIEALRAEAMTRKTIQSSDIEELLVDDIKSEVSDPSELSSIHAIIADIIKTVNTRMSIR